MKRYVRVGLLATGIIFTLIGAYRGEAIKVLMKAVKICLECIGVG